MSWSSIIVTTRFSFTRDDKFVPTSPVSTTKPNRIKTIAVEIHNVTDCKPIRCRRDLSGFLFFIQTQYTKFLAKLQHKRAKSK